MSEKVNEDLKTAVIEKPNACIITFFMNNIDMKSVGLQRSVVEKYNKSKHPHYSIHTDMKHGASMDFAWALNGVPHPTFKGHNVEKKIDHEIILFLDVDAIPLNEDAIDYTVGLAASGHLVGDIQNSNHIQNDKHLFVAPSVLAISVSTMATIKYPSAVETKRADVAEEITFAAEKFGIPIDFYYPLCYDEKPAECEFWTLKEGMPVYGRGTTFGHEQETRDNFLVKDSVPMFWHQFQSFHPGQQEKFWKKCEEVLQK
jgi:hypothetical protein